MGMVVGLVLGGFEFDTAYWNQGRGGNFLLVVRKKIDYCREWASMGGLKEVAEGSWPVGRHSWAANSHVRAIFLSLDCMSVRLFDYIVSRLSTVL
jgi:hypothetical protein